MGKELIFNGKFPGTVSFGINTDGLDDSDVWECPDGRNIEGDTVEFTVGCLLAMCVTEDEIVEVNIRSDDTLPIEDICGVDLEAKEINGILGVEIVAGNICVKCCCWDGLECIAVEKVALDPDALVDENCDIDDLAGMKPDTLEEAKPPTGFETV